MELQRVELEAGSVSWGSGFYDTEQESGFPFRWMSAQGRLQWEPIPEPAFLEIEVFTPTRDLSQTLTIESGPARECFALVHGWSSRSVELPRHVSSVELRASHVLPAQAHPGDPRRLAIRVRSPVLHRDGERHRTVTASAENAERNMREMLSGATRLESTPVSLGIDMHGACNVNPPCVYCDWDESKRLEGVNVTRPFTVETLRSYGRLFEKASQLVNCSIGEPFMKRDLPDILGLVDDHGPLLELSTNGQILTETQLRSLLGRRIHLYVSIDAATAETYARLRNRRFAPVIENVRRIVQAKGGRGRYPLVFLVFMPMPANLDELDAFVRLCAELEVDQFVLRPLNVNPDLNLRWSRGDYSFNYQRELLPLDEKIRIAGRAQELCRILGVPFANQLDFGGATSTMFEELFEEGRQQARGQGADETSPSDSVGARLPAAAVPSPSPADEATVSSPPSPVVADAALTDTAWPICTEPWRALYIVRRGVLPCCYGGRPIAEMDEGEAAWNGPTLRSIREGLAQGRFHRYCLRTTSCPIVQKHRRRDALPPGERALARLYDVWFTLNRWTGGIPRGGWRLAKTLYSFARRGGPRAS
jgi:MoaA/NifB/PqqE/SkfB family radical SAM enzyme